MKLRHACANAGRTLRDEDKKKEKANIDLQDYILQNVFDLIMRYRAI